MWVRKNSIKTENQMKNENQLLIKVVFITTLIFILSLLENIYEHTHTQARTKYLQLLLEFSLLFLLMIYTVRNKSFCQQDIEKKQTGIRLIYRQIMK